MERKKARGSTANPAERKSKKSVRKAKPVVATEDSLSATPERSAPSEDEIARKAYALWELRGKPFGSPDDDWYRAEHDLHNGAL